MKLLVNDIRLQYDENREAEIILKAKGNIDINELKEIVAKGKELVAEIKQYRHKRSLDSNAYMWVLLGKMASVLNTSKEEVYLSMLDAYGVYTHIVVKPEIVERVKTEWKTVLELGEVTINGKTGIQLQCYFGSSTYDTKEMCTLIDGVVSEAKELGTDTVSTRELEIMKNAWGVK